MAQMDISIIIPTWNRSHLVKDLLYSLYEERKRYTGGATEVLVIDSSTGAEQASIVQSCQEYEATYFEGDNSVRKKRNKGIRAAQYDYILFIDSDVVAEAGLLDAYHQGYEKNSHLPLGGVLGYTEFVGEKTFWWKILELTPLVDAFSFARNYPFHSWTIGNNVSFRKDVLEEIGLFEENFPFKLGGDDLDMTYRVTKAGYMIGSAPDAVTYHSRETWNSFRAIHDRAKRWGTMERHICNRHPELYKRVIPKNYVLMSLVWLVSGLLGLITAHWLPLLIAGIWTIFELVASYARHTITKGAVNPLHYLCAKGVEGLYECYRIKQSFQEKSLGAFTHGQVFNRYQIKFGLAKDCDRMIALLGSYSVISIIVLLLSTIAERGGF